MMIEAIIFDYGGVLCKEGRILKVFSEHYYKKTNLVCERTKEIIIGLWNKARVSGIDSKVFWEKSSELFQMDANEFKKEFIEFSDFREDLYGFVTNGLKGRYKLALLTNQIKSWLEPVIEERGFREIFDVIVTSYETGIAKPDIRIFKETVKRLGTKPENCIFVDDLSKNIPPAREMGMKTILFNDLEQLKKELSLFGVEF